MTSSPHCSPEDDSPPVTQSTPERPGSFGVYLAGAVVGSIIVAVPLSAAIFFVNGGISSPPGSLMAAFGGVIAGFFAGPVIAVVGSLLAKLAEIALRKAGLLNVWRGVLVGGAAVLPHLLWLVPFPSLYGASFVAVLWTLFGVSAVGQWRGGFARANR